MSFEELVGRIEAGGDLPTIGSVASEVLRLGSDPSADFRAVGRVIQRDPSLTARVLRAANSPYYGLRGEVSGVERAVSLLGMREVRNIALSVSVINDFSGRLGREGFNWERFWEHSLGSALIAQALGRLLQLPTDGEEYVAGLLHDVGKILLGHHLPDEFSRALDLATAEQISMEKAEVRVFGFDHARLGEWMMGRWAFPAPLCDAVGSHHHPEKANGGRLLAAAVHLADTLAKAKCVGFGGDDLAVCLNDDPSWAVLVEASPTLADLDLERFTLRLDREVEAARDLVRNTRSP